jgi:pimeloyl-ACP methyl ester carboxylesterase
MLLNPGGPGGQGLGMPLMMKDELPPSVQEQYDLIGFDPRGVGQSSPITCGLTSEESGLLYPYKPQTFAKDVDRARTVARKCATQGGQEIAYITTRSTARDMDVIRAVLGEKKLSYLGYSYGTYLGAVYTQLFPKRADRIVLDSAVDPQLAWRGMIQSWSAGSQPAFLRWAEWTARHAAEFGLGATPAEVSKTFWDLVAQADKTPIDWDGVPMTGDDIRIGARRAVFSPREAATMIAALNKAAHGGAADPAQAARLRAFAATAEPADDNSISVFLAVVCNDVANWPRDPERYRRDAIRDKARYPLAGDVTSNIFPCAFWRVPRTERSSRVDNAVGALVVQNEWDSQTPVFSGLGMHRALKGSRLVFVDEGEGHGVYFKSGNACAYRAVSDYLDTGELPAKDVTCVADPESSRSLLPGATAPRLPGPF